MFVEGLKLEFVQRRRLRRKFYVDVNYEVVVVVVENVNEDT